MHVDFVNWPEGFVVGNRVIGIGLKLYFLFPLLCFRFVFFFFLLIIYIYIDDLFSLLLVGILKNQWHKTENKGIT